MYFKKYASCASPNKPYLRDIPHSPLSMKHKLWEQIILPGKEPEERRFRKIKTLLTQFGGYTVSPCSKNNPEDVSIPPPLRPKKTNCMTARINDIEKFNRKNTTFWTVLRDGVRVLLWRVAVWLEWVFGRQNVTNAQASWLAQMGRGIRSGQTACRLFAFARRAMDSTCAGVRGRSYWAATNPHFCAMRNSFMIWECRKYST